MPQLCYLYYQIYNQGGAHFHDIWMQNPPYSKLVPFGRDDCILTRRSRSGPFIFNGVDVHSAFVSGLVARWVRDLGQGSTIYGPIRWREAQDVINEMKVGVIRSAAAKMRVLLEDGFSNLMSLERSAISNSYSPPEH